MPFSSMHISPLPESYPNLSRRRHIGMHYAMVAFHQLPGFYIFHRLLPSLLHHLPLGLQ
jgi:hypothetical protein